MTFDSLLERVIVTENKFIYKNIFRTKTLHFSNTKGFNTDRSNMFLFSLDDTIILGFDKSLKYKKEKIYDYIWDNFEYLEEEQEEDINQ